MARYTYYIDELINRRTDEQINEEIKEIIFNINKVDYKLMVNNSWGLNVKFWKDKNKFLNLTLKKYNLMLKLVFLDKFKQLENYKKILLKFLEDNNFYYLKYTFYRTMQKMPRYNIIDDEINLNRMLKRLKSFYIIDCFITYYTHKNLNRENADLLFEYMEDEPLLKYRD
jgi:hypothetical protein